MFEHNIAKDRAVAYDSHYRTAGWHAARWTKAQIEASLMYALDVPKGGSLRGNEFQIAFQAVNVADLRGKVVLDCCCGSGLTAVYFALCGAKVHAFDSSKVAIEMAHDSAQRSGVEHVTCFSIADAQKLPYADSSFDAAFCQSALHIIIDYPDCSRELARVMKPGAKLVFCDEPLGHNPAFECIRYLRRRQYRQCGGRTLKLRDIDQFGAPFSDVTVHYVNLLTQAKTLFNKHMDRRGCLAPWARRVLRGLENVDRKLLSAVPWLRKRCGAVVVEYVK